MVATRRMLTVFVVSGEDGILRIHVELFWMIAHSQRTSLSSGKSFSHCPVLYLIVLAGALAESGGVIGKSVASQVKERV